MAKSEKQPEEEDTDGISYTMLLPLAIVGSWVAGALTARLIVRREIDKLRAETPAKPAIPAPTLPAKEAAAPAGPAVAAKSVAAPVPQPPVEEQITDEILSV